MMDFQYFYKLCNMKALASCSGQFKMIIDLNLNLKKDLIFIQLHSHKQTTYETFTYILPGALETNFSY